MLQVVYICNPYSTISVHVAQWLDFRVSKVIKCRQITCNTCTRHQLPGDCEVSLFPRPFDRRDFFTFLNDICDGILGIFAAIWDNFFVNTVRDLGVLLKEVLEDSSSQAVKMSTAASPVT